MKITQEEKERWIEHVKGVRIKHNRYNPNTVTKEKYLFLANETERLGGINPVMKEHRVGRNTVLNAIRYKNKINEQNNTAPRGSSVRLGWLKP